MSGKGFLMAMMEPVATFEEEFQDWYDNEHVPERMAIPGFETGQRFVCLAGFPKYAAFYDLSSLDVLRSPEYSRVVGAGLSPLTLRVRAKTVGRYRFTGTQIYPGAANLGASGAPVRLLMLRFSNAQVSDEARMLAGLRENFEGRTGVSQLRLFRGVAEEGGGHIAIVEYHLNACSLDIDPVPFGALIKQLDCINTYTPYWRNHF